MNSSMNEKKIFFILSLFVLNSFAGHSQSTATISGTIENQNAASVQVVVDRLYLNKKPETITGAVNNGQFSLSVSVDASRLVEITADYFHAKIFIEPGDKLEVNVKNSSVTFSGSGSEQNTFLKTFYETFKKD